MKQVKEVEQSVLKTFQTELPSVYYSDKTEKEYKQFKENAIYMYHDLFKFPPDMFRGKKLIDFGAGTGESTVYLAEWGAKCTLVEMNDIALNIAKEVFQKYTNNYEDHNFFLSSIFDYNNSSEKYDIVRASGVLSHTAAKEQAFSKIATYIKPGGYFIYGDPNKSGGFQNMLQRYIIYKFSQDWESMVQTSEYLFKYDIDRSQSFVNRTRRAIIFDRWVVQKQDDPSVKEVLQWLDNNNLILYSAYPPITFPVFGDSVHHQPKYYAQSFKDIGTFVEAIWLMQNESDSVEIPKILSPLSEIAKSQSALVDYFSNTSQATVIENDEAKLKVDNYIDSFKNADITSYILSKIKLFMNEVKDVLDLIERNDIHQVKNYISKTKLLFRGATGVRHVDFIAYKKNN